jgi:hypothetical protein
VWSRVFANLEKAPAYILLTVVTLAGLGCGETGPNRFSAGGAVLFDGKPMKNGIIRFVPVNGTKGPALAGIIQDGFYDFSREKGAVVGDYRVEIEGQLETPFEIDDDSAYAKAYESARKNPLPPQPVPAIYNSKSNLIITITPNAEANKFDFDLTKKEQRSAKR